jgi:predicted NAD/FAD-binding protein
VTSVAIIGTGIAGMGCGHFLHPSHRLTFYERNDYVGGHTNTVTVDEEGTPVHVDTGFMVYNEATYPNLTRLFALLGAPTMDTDMSFSVQHTPSGLEWCGSGLDGLFAQRRNLLRPAHYRFLGEVHRFNTTSPEILEDETFAGVTLGEYVAAEGYSDDFLWKYLIPMGSAVWSSPPAEMLAFPARTLVQFFKNHGFLGLNTQHQWKTLAGGSQRYREKLIAPFRDAIQCGRAALRVERTGSGATVHAADGSAEPYDRVIIAAHADEALALLAAPTANERRLLAPFRYQMNTATLHTDPSVMPRTRRAWSSWNYRLDKAADGSTATTTIYSMNRLQKVSRRKEYFVSINDPGLVRRERILRTFTYAHPLFSVEAARAQRELPSLNASGPVYFCGSYFRFGFHEDAFTSALELCRTITGEPLWR